MKNGFVWDVVENIPLGQFGGSGMIEEISKRAGRSAEPLKDCNF